MGLEPREVPGGSNGTQLLQGGPGFRREPEARRCDCCRVGSNETDGYHGRQDSGTVMPLPLSENSKGSGRDQRRNNRTRE